MIAMDPLAKLMYSSSFVMLTFARETGCVLWVGLAIYLDGSSEEVGLHDKFD